MKIKGFNVSELRSLWNFLIARFVKIWFMDYLHQNHLNQGFLNCVWWSSCFFFSLLRGWLKFFVLCSVSGVPSSWVCGLLGTQPKQSSPELCFLLHLLSPTTPSTAGEWSSPELRLLSAPSFPPYYLFLSSTTGNKQFANSHCAQSILNQQAGGSPK